MAGEWVIECREVDLSFGPVKVLEKVSFTLPERETLCVVGPNGGGKSTLLKVLLGLLRPQSGEVRILGESPSRARRRVGYMPQYIQIDPLFPIDIEGIVRMGRLEAGGWGFYSREDRKAAERALEEVNLLEYRREPWINLSGGMKQRVLIARALVNNPELLLLDEPTAMVDAHVEAKLLEHLKALHDRMTIVLVSHDASFVSGLVDEVLCINRTAHLHPLEAVDDPAMSHLYGEPVKSVQHEHDLPADAAHDQPGHEGPERA